MAFILPLLFIIFFTESLMLIFKTKFNKTLPLTFIIPAIMLYLSQFLFKTFSIGFIICILISLLFPICLIKNKSKINYKDYITKELLTFIILYIIIFILDFNRFFTRWDELSHWGKMVKEMYKLDSFYSINKSNLLVHKDYPPIAGLLELFYTFLCTKYKEVYLIRCIHLFEGSLVLSCIEIKDKNSIKKSIFVIFFSYLITFLFDSAIVINSIYTDYLLSVLTASILYNIFNLEKVDIFNIFKISLSLIFLILLKQISIAFYLMIIFFLIFTLIIKRIKVNNKNKLLIIILIIIMPLLFLFSWNSYVNKLNIKGQFNVNDINLYSFKEIISSDITKDYRKQSLVNYSLAIFNKPMLNSEINLSYFRIGIILLFLIILMLKYIKSINKKEFILLSVTLFIGYLFYVILMLLLYVYCFDEFEGPQIASYDRYMSSYLLICFYLIIFIYSYYNEIKINKKILSTIFLILIIINPISYVKLRPDLILLNNHTYDEYKSAAVLIDKNTNNNDKVFIIDQLEKNGAMYYINYFSNKISTNKIMYDFKTELDDSESYFYSNYYEYLKSFDYVYTYSIDNNFINKYSFLTKNEIKEKKLYKIEKKQGKIFLKEIR